MLHELACCCMTTPFNRRGGNAQVLTPLQQAQLVVAAQPYKVDMLSFSLAVLGQSSSPTSSQHSSEGCCMQVPSLAVLPTWASHGGTTGMHCCTITS